MFYVFILGTFGFSCWSKLQQNSPEFTWRDDFAWMSPLNQKLCKYQRNKFKNMLYLKSFTTYISYLNFIASRLYVRVVISLTCAKHLHDRIISLKCEAGT